MVADERGAFAQAVYLYDTEPGGSGVCQLLVAQDKHGRHTNFAEAVRVMGQKVDLCNCEVACPKCLMQYGCTAKNSLRTLSRQQVTSLLTGALTLIESSGPDMQ